MIVNAPSRGLAKLERAPVELLVLELLRQWSFPLVASSAFISLRNTTRNQSVFSLFVCLKVHASSSKLQLYQVPHSHRQILLLPQLRNTKQSQRWISPTHCTPLSKLTEDCRSWHQLDPLLTWLLHCSRIVNLAVGIIMILGGVSQFFTPHLYVAPVCRTFASEPPSCCRGDNPNALESHARLLSQCRTWLIADGRSLY